MKQTNKLYKICLLCTAIMLHGRCYTEGVHVTGDYTLSGTVDGDLVVTNGSISIPLGYLAVNGDVKIMSGKVILNDGQLLVNGDLIVTNTESSGMVDASVTVTGNIEVAGSIITKSANGVSHIKAFDKATPIGVGSISANAISTNGNAVVEADHHITVAGPIVTKSTSGDAYVRSNGIASVYGNIYAGSISTDGNTDAYVHAVQGNLVVNGSIITKSTNQKAYVVAEGKIESASIHTKGDQESYILCERLDVLGDISTESENGDAYIYLAWLGVYNPNIYAANIYTKGSGDAYVYTFSNQTGGTSDPSDAGNITVMGDIITKATGSNKDAYIRARGANTSSGSIIANNLSTNATGFADIQSSLNGSTLRVANNISAKSSNGDAYISVPNGTIYAGSIYIDAQSVASLVATTGSGVDVKGPIRVKSATLNAYINVTGGNLVAHDIYTNAAQYGIISAPAINVKGALESYSTSNTAYIIATTGNIEAGNIKTSANYDAYVESTNGSITVDKDICTQSIVENAYVKAPAGNLKARSIKTIAPTGKDDSIQSAVGSGRFKLFPNKNDVALIIKDSEFYFDSDQDWNTKLTLQGTCTLDGKGHELIFDSNGGIEVASGGVLLLKNIKVSKLWGDAIKCADNTSTLSCEDVVWSQTSDTVFQNGALQIVGDCVVEGPGTIFSYESSRTSTIHKNSMLSFVRTVAFKYNSASADDIYMENSTARLRFDEADLRATQDVQFINGTLVFDNSVTFYAETSKSITFGKGVLANNLSFDFHELHQFHVFGTLINNNA